MLVQVRGWMPCLTCVGIKTMSTQGAEAELDAFSQALIWVGLCVTWVRAEGGSDTVGAGWAEEVAV